MGRVPAGSVGRVVKVGFFGGYDVNFGRGRVLHDVTRDVLRFPTADRGGRAPSPVGAEPL
jgi:hypothetical protein